MRGELESRARYGGRGHSPPGGYERRDTRGAQGKGVPHERKGAHLREASARRVTVEVHVEVPHAHQPRPGCTCLQTWKHI